MKRSTSSDSDQSSLFTFLAWIDPVKRVGNRISMNGNGRYLDNVFIEHLCKRPV